MVDYSHFFIYRQQVTEIIFVLKAVSTLIDSLKKTQPENGKLLLNNMVPNKITAPKIDVLFPLVVSPQI